MKLSKNFHLGLGLLFTIEFIYSLSDQHVTHELFFWDVNFGFTELIDLPWYFYLLRCI